MKKLFLVSLALITMTAAQAQLKVIPTLKKGMEKVYETKASMTLPGQPTINMVSDTKYTVSDATANGYIIDVVTTSFSSDAAKDNITGQIMTAAQEMAKGVHILIATDKNGKPVKIANYDELRTTVQEYDRHQQSIAALRQDHYDGCPRGDCQQAGSEYEAHVLCQR